MRECCRRYKDLLKIADDLIAQAPTVMKEGLEKLKAFVQSEDADHANASVEANECD